MGKSKIEYLEHYSPTDFRNTVENAEVRNVGAKIEKRSADKGPGTLSGYALKFDLMSKPIYDPDLDKKFVEKIDPLSLARTLRERPDIRSLHSHDTSIVLGRTTSGTLRLFIDETGLRFENDLPDTGPGRDNAVLVERGDVDGCSFGFVVREDDWEEGPNGLLIRTLHDIDLHEISPTVAFPAYIDTEVNVARSMSSRRKPSQVEDWEAEIEIERERLILLGY